MRYIFVLCFFHASIFLSAQFHVNGRIYDASNKPISDANVVVKDLAGVILAFTSSDEKGVFKLNYGSKEKAILSISALQFETFTKEIENKGESQDYNFVLKNKTYEIDAVYLEKNEPIIQKNDTIVFKAKHFQIGNETVIEDLLKKIPGINVDENGVIKIAGKEVEKVMVDGDDFFEKGYKLLTQNMPVAPIENIEIYQNYSNNKHLKGIENSDRVALNLTLNDESKDIWFGNLAGGHAVFPDDRYDWKVNVMKFSKKNKHYFLGRSNTIGVAGLENVNQTFQENGSGEPGHVGGDQTAFNLIELDLEKPSLKANRVNFLDSHFVSLNSIYNLSSKIKLKSVIFLNDDRSKFFRKSLSSYYAFDTVFQNKEDYEGSNLVQTGFAKLNFTYDFSTKSTFEYQLKYSRSDNNRTSYLLFNEDELQENLKSENELFENKLKVTSKINKRGVLVFSARFILENAPQNYRVNRFMMGDLLGLSDGTNTAQRTTDNMFFAGSEVQWLQKFKSDDLLEITMGLQHRRDYLTTNLEVFNHDLVLNVPATLQNDMVYSKNDNYLTAKYHLKLGEFTLNPLADFHKVYNYVEQPNFLDREESKFYIIPKLRAEWKIGKHKIEGIYFFNQTSPALNDVYIGYVQTGFRTLLKGLKNLDFLTSSEGRFGYTYGDYSDRFFTTLFLVSNHSYNYFSTNSRVLQDYVSVEKSLIHDRKYALLSMTADYYVKYIKSNFKFIGTLSNLRFQNSVNENLQRVSQLNYDLGLRSTSSFKGFLNYNFGFTWNRSTVKSISEYNNNSSHYFLDLIFSWNKNVNIQVKSERYNFVNRNNYSFLDVEAKYTVMPNKLTLFVSGNNLTNVRKFRNFAINDISMSETEYRLLPRYAMLKVEYQF